MILPRLSPLEKALCVHYFLNHVISTPQTNSIVLIHRNPVIETLSEGFHLVYPGILFRSVESFALYCHRPCRSSAAIHREVHTTLWHIDVSIVAQRGLFMSSLQNFCRALSSLTDIFFSIYCVSICIDTRKERPRDQIRARTIHSIMSCFTIDPIILQNLPISLCKEILNRTECLCRNTEKRNCYVQKKYCNLGHT